MENISTEVDPNQKIVDMARKGSKIRSISECFTVGEGDKEEEEEIVVLCTGESFQEHEDPDVSLSLRKRKSVTQLGEPTFGVSKNFPTGSVDCTSGTSPDADSMDVKVSFQCKDMGRKASKSSIPERTRKLSKKFSTTSNTSGFSISSSFTSSCSDNPYLHLMHDAKDCKASQDRFKRNISQEVDTSRLSSDSNPEMDSDFVLEDLELMDDITRTVPSAVTTDPAGTSDDPNRKDNRRRQQQKTFGKQSGGGSKIFEYYQKTIRDSQMDKENNSVQLEVPKLADMQIIRRSSCGDSQLAADSGFNRPAAARHMKKGYRRSADVSDSVLSDSFVRKSTARSTFCVSQIKNTRLAQSDTDPKKNVSRSQSVRKSFQKFGGEVAKTFKSLTGKNN